MLRRGNFEKTKYLRALLLSKVEILGAGAEVAGGV
jgi:hypothetical protein